MFGVFVVECVVVCMFITVWVVCDVSFNVMPLLVMCMCDHLMCLFGVHTSSLLCVVLVL